MILFETERMIVRRFTPADGDDFFALNGNADAMHFIRPAKNRADSDAFLQDNLNLYLDGSMLGRFAVYHKTNGNFLGTFSFLYLSGEANYHIGYALVPEAWGQGYATELVKTGTPYFFAGTDHARLFAITHPDNKPSQQVLLKNGYRQEGQMTEGDKIVEIFIIDRS
ncbi:MAG: GNAT family N-acetyltransferase [Chitinophagaceae bacterium]|nr:GNAT family N-acetyltransferase [Chitinophagaceae bacterium]